MRFSTLTTPFSAISFSPRLRPSAADPLRVSATHTLVWTRVSLGAGFQLTRRSSSEDRPARYLPMAEGAWLLWRGCMTGLRASWLLEVLVVLPFLPPRIVPMLKSGAKVVRKTQGFRGGSCGIFPAERAASVVERAASMSRLSKRMFRG